MPKDFWESYSAMANTDGGSIFLGVSKKKGKFSIIGIATPSKVIKELIDTANNSEKVSVNLLENNDIILHEQGGIKFLEIRIRRATRKERPVYLKKTPMGNTFRRLHEADQRLTEEEVKRMLADQQYDSLDTRILDGFSLEDLNEDSLLSFQQSVANRIPESNFETLSRLDFLKQVGGWKKNRETGQEGLTVAGLLMFGNYQSIRDEYSSYFVDYQEHPESKTGQRYVDRVCPDLTWSGNLYDFYRKVYPKLVSDLKLGFQLKGGIREGESSAHIAVREAFVNALVHADYSVPTSLLVVKRPDLFGFKNPGLMRIPLNIALEGGESDSRNKTIQDMFRMIGAGERQGFGIRKILQGWKEFDWRLPHFQEEDKPTPRVVVTLSMLSLFPEKAVSYFKTFYEKPWESASEIKKVALVLAFTERAVSHNRLSQFSSKHPKDISDCLRNMESDGLLSSTGAFRSKTYHLPHQKAPSPEEVFDSVDLDLNSPNLDPSSPNLDELGRIVHDNFTSPLIEDLKNLNGEYLTQLQGKAASPRTKKKIPREEMIQVILSLCDGQFMALQALSELINREPESLRGQYLKRLKDEGKLAMAFPRTPNDPRQAYLTVK